MAELINLDDTADAVLLMPAEPPFVALRDAGYITESELNGIGNDRDNKRLNDKIHKCGPEDIKALLVRIGDIIRDAQPEAEKTDSFNPILPADLPPLMMRLREWHAERNFESSACFYCPEHCKGGTCPEGADTAKLDGEISYMNDCDWFNAHIDTKGVPVVFPR